MFQMKSVKEQFALQDTILQERLDTILPEVMKRSKADCWIIASKEYNEDILFDAITPASYLTARRITILIFLKEQDTIQIGRAHV